MPPNKWAIKNLTIVDQSHIVFRSVKQDIFLFFFMLFTAVGFVALSWLFLSLPPSPGQEQVQNQQAEQIVPWLGILLFGSLFVVTLWASAPFRLAVDLDTRTYTFERGIFPLVCRWSGSLSDVRQISMTKINGKGGTYYRVTLAWKSKLRADAILSNEKEQGRAEDLVDYIAEMLHVPPAMAAALP